MLALCKVLKAAVSIRAVACEPSQGLEVALGSYEALASHRMHGPELGVACATKALMSEPAALGHGLR